MATKIVIGMNDGKTVQKEITEDQLLSVVGKKIGQTISGDDIGLTGYEFKITGGSDISGTPMRWDVEGSGKRRILAVSGIGIKKQSSGMKKRKTVAGNTVSDKIAQLNLAVVKIGAEPLVVAEAKKE